MAGVLALVAGASALACFDVFHSTSFETACAIDAAACEDGGAVVADSGSPGSADASTDFCAWDAGTAQQVAVRACAWLGACAGAIADDAYGPCLLRATLAYDCSANPARPVMGAAHAYWDCLSKVASCGDVEACLEPSGTRGKCSTTATGYAGCEGSTNPATFIACDAGAATGTAPAAIESCAAFGQACFSSGLGASCSGSPTACTTPGTSCGDDGGLHDCDPDGGVLDFGVSCASFGAGQCVTLPSGSAACLAAGQPSCAASSAVSCDTNGVATGCPSGVPELVTCPAVPGLACNPTAPGRPWDVSRACYTGPCGTDSCSADRETLTSCVRGATVSLDCAKQGLGPCALATYPGDLSPHAQCGAP